MRLREQRLKNSSLGLANSLRGFGAGAMPSMWDQLQEIGCPTLILAGELDHKYTAIAHDMGSRINRAQVKIVPNSGHTPHLEQPAYFQQIVSDFLVKNEVTSDDS